MEDYCKIYIEAECSKADLKSYVMANLGEIFGEVNDVHVFVDKMTAQSLKDGSRELSFHQP